MGAATFITYVEGPDATTAFRQAVDAAAYTYGTDIYSGTIATKNTFETHTDTPMTYAAAAAEAKSVLDAGERYGKWGPAGAIPVLPDPPHAPAPRPSTTTGTGTTSGPEQEQQPPAGWLFFGWAPE